MEFNEERIKLKKKKQCQLLSLPLTVIFFKTYLKALSPKQLCSFQNVIEHMKSLLVVDFDITLLSNYEPEKNLNYKIIYCSFLFATILAGLRCSFITHTYKVKNIYCHTLNSIIIRDNNLCRPHWKINRRQIRCDGGTCKGVGRT